MSLDKKFIGRQIRLRRMEQNISQEKFSELIEISPRHMCTIENGKSFPSLETLVKIADILHLNLNEFFNLPETKDDNPLRLEIMQLVQISDEKDLQLIKDLVRAVHLNRLYK